MLKRIPRWIFFFSLVLLYACANVVTPSGGYKDVIPPKVVKYKPENRSTHFSSKKIKITFNEFVVLNNLNAQLQIQPFILNAPKIYLSGKSVVIKFIDTLQKNTTYNFDFGNSIADFTENNPMSGLEYTFSTGDYIDSGFVFGRVVDAFTLKPEKGISVMLYKHFLDSLPLKQVPNYLAKSDENGYFVFRNIPNNTKYKIFALNDVNSTYIFDLPTEKIAFGDSLVQSSYIHELVYDSLGKFTPVKNLSDKGVYSSAKMNLLLFMNEDTIQRVLNASLVKDNHFIIAFRLPINADSLQLLPYKDYRLPALIKQFNNTCDTIRFWINEKNPPDSLKFRLFIGQQCLDTITIPSKQRAIIKTGGRNKLIVTDYNTNISNQQLDFHRDLTISMENPIKQIDSSKVIIKKGKDTLVALLHFADKVQRVIRFANAFIPDTLYRITLLPGAITNIWDKTNDTILFQFKRKKETDYANIKLKFENLKSDKVVLLHLLTEQDKLVQEIKVLNQTVNINFINPGKYKIRLIFDENNNGRWDTGNYGRKKQPEQVIFYPKEIILKENFTLETDWDISKTNNP